MLSKYFIAGTLFIASLPSRIALVCALLATAVPKAEAAFVSFTDSTAPATFVVPLG